MTDIAATTVLWALEDIALISDGPSSRVYRARQRDRSVIVKILKPAGMDEAMGMDLLRWRDGHGAVRLLAQQDHAYLLEDGGSQTLQQRFFEGGDAASLEELARVVAALHEPSLHTTPRTLIPLERQFEALFTPARHKALRERPALVGWAAALARELLSSQRDIRPLHGDMHHGNVVSPDGVRWKAIDPKGLVGDPLYDYANIFGNPIEARDAVLDRDRCIRLADTFARYTARADGNAFADRSRILRFAAANSVLSACWSLEEPQSEEDFRDGLQRLELAEILQSLVYA